MGRFLVSDRTLQVSGVIIIAASIGIIAFLATNNALAAQPHQPARTFFQQDSQPGDDSDGSNVVEISFKAGRKWVLSEYFSPSSISIQTGETVTWINNDTVGHTVTSVAFHSDQIWPQTEHSRGSSSFSHTFEKNGVYSYFCQIHPYMSGTVYVNAEETQRRLTSTTTENLDNTIIEIPYDTAYRNHFDHGFFIPANTFLLAGGRVTWINNDYVAHTATATDGSFDTNVLDPHGSKTMTIDQAGRIAYYCRIHPWMQGSITVLPN